MTAARSPRKEQHIRSLAELLAEMVEAAVDERLAGAEFYDQRTSPLGKRRHLELARAGKFPSVKVGTKVLVRREDLHAFMEREGIRRGKAPEDEGVDEIVEGILKGGGGRRR
jgi:excisionase family DNA binding protein